MTTILSSDELLHRAVRWISEQRTLDPRANVAKLVQQASARFDLSPSAEQWLIETFAREHRQA